jgi:ABC-type Fe3+ transport system permease subunit
METEMKRRLNMHAACYLALVIAYVVAAIAYAALVIDAASANHAPEVAHATADTRPAPDDEATDPAQGPP